MKIKKLGDRVPSSNARVVRSRVGKWVRGKWEALRGVFCGCYCVEEADEGGTPVEEGEWGVVEEKVEGVLVEEGERAVVEEGEGGFVEEERVSVEEEEGGVAAGGEGEGSSGEVGKRVFGSRELGIREQIREHFRMVRRVLAGEYPVRKVGRVVHWDGPSVRPRTSPRFRGRQRGPGEVGIPEGLEEGIVALQAMPDDFAVYGNFAMARVGSEQFIGPLESIQLAFGGPGVGEVACEVGFGRDGLQGANLALQARSDGFAVLRDVRFRPRLRIFGGLSTVFF